ncbi:hypothetical protein BASA81_003378 [Batrachochytrium salamandrivorans]|nr:hypothetical protein BASA81_003378 [Batrachochytrium salamandrivorans]
MEDDDVFETSSPALPAQVKRPRIEPESSDKSKPKPSKKKNPAEDEPPTEQEAYLKLQGLEGEHTPFTLFVAAFPTQLLLPKLDPLAVVNIQVNPETGQMELSSNTTCIVQNGTVISPPGKAALRPNDALGIGSEYRLYALFPELDKPKPSYADLVVDLLLARQPQTLGCKDLAVLLCQQHGYYNVKYGSQNRLPLLIKAVQSAISKSDKIISVPLAGQGGRVHYQLGNKRKE